MAQSTIRITKQKGAQSLFTFEDQVRVQYGEDFAKIAAEIQDNLVLNTTKTRTTMDKLVEARLIGVNEYITEVQKWGVKLVGTFGTGKQTITPGRMRNLQSQLNKLSTTIKSWAQPQGKGGKRFNIDHKDINVCLVTTVLVYEYLEGIRQVVRTERGSSAQAISDKRGRFGDSGAGLEIEYGPPSNRKTNSFSDREFDELIRDVQYSIAAGSALKNALQSNRIEGESLSALTNEFLVDNNFDLTSTKEKVIEVGTGKAQTIFQITSAAWNRQKGVVEKYLKRIPFLKQLGGVAGTNTKVFKDMEANFQPGKPNSLTAMKGSRSMEEEMAQQATQLLVKGKAKKYKANAKKVGSKKTKGSSKTTNVMKDIAVNSALAAKTLKTGANNVGSSRQRKSNNKEKEMAFTQREINKIITKINKRLPAEVRRQMGRPALINRTGRFSNSARLLTMKATRGGMAGKYSYLLQPYETFENTGERRWSPGYNPKPLIAKSIRELAQQIIGNKVTITLRRG